MEKTEFEDPKGQEDPSLLEAEKTRLIMDAAGDYAIMLLNTRGNVTMWSKGAERILGYAEPEILGRAGEIFFLPEEREAGEPEAEMRSAEFSGRAEDERWHVRRDGTRFFASGVMTAIRDGHGHLMGFCKVMRDITDRMVAQEALRQSQEYFAALVNSIEGIVWEADGITGRHTFVNKKAESILGHPQEKWLQEYWDTLVYEEDRETVRAHWEKAFREKKGYTLDFRLLDGEGRKRWFRDYVSAVEMPSGTVKLRAVLVEVTTQKAAERRQEMQLQVTSILARSSELQKALREILPILGEGLEWDVVIYWHMRPGGKSLVPLQHWSAEASWTGNGPFADILQDLSDPGGELTAALATKNPVWVPDLKSAGGNATVRMARASEAGLSAGFASPVLVGDQVQGVLEFFSSRSKPMESADMGSAFAVASQIGQFENRLRTEAALWDSQEQLRQSQKMEAIGRLAGGIAHDFNNLLTAINGYGDLLMEKLEPQSPLRPDLEEIRKAGMRAASLTHQLLAYSRKQVMKPRVVNLNSIISEMGTMLSRLLGENINLDMRLDPDLNPIKMDPGQLEQVVMNLAVNSRDAMPDGGSLILETSNVVLTAPQPGTFFDLPSGEYARLSVKDTGKGIPDSVKVRIFEPFFTTKEKGKGTGLGLSMVYGIVKQSGGSVSLASEPDKGATFTIYLPTVAEETVPSPPRTDADEKGQDGAGETILLVEDEEGVRNLAREILRSRGYAVIAARGGEEALSAEAGHAGPIDLLLTDFILEGMNGREVYEAVSKRRPGIRVLYMSGYTEDEIVRHGVETSGSSFLHKPFSPKALVEKVGGFFRESRSARGEAP